VKRRTNKTRSTVSYDAQANPDKALKLEQAADTSFEPDKLDSTNGRNANGPDPFDPASLRLPDKFGETVGVQKALLCVPVRKPDKSWFVRAHPDKSYRLQTGVIELGLERGKEIFLVAPELRKDLVTEATFKPKLLVTAINRQGVLFIWEVNLPGPDGRVNEWTRTGLEAVELATKSWIRISANMPLCAYDIYKANGQLSEPEWPQIPFRDLLRVAFKDRFIDSIDHPVLRRLRGEA
jgi:hypothetical protein